MDLFALRRSSLMMTLARFRSAERRLKDASLVIGGRACVYHKALCAFHSLSFSQEGEDAILWRIFERQTIGFYVDIGAHHPQRFSNTYRFYLRG